MISGQDLTFFPFDHPNAKDQKNQDSSLLTFDFTNTIDFSFLKIWKKKPFISILLMLRDSPFILLGKPFSFYFTTF